MWSQYLRMPPAERISASDIHGVFKYDSMLSCECNPCDTGREVLVMD
jgi:hypothetical protein